MSDRQDRAAALVAVWREVEATVPFLGHRVGWASTRARASVAAGQRRRWWRLEQGGTACGLAATLGLSELQALPTVDDLVPPGGRTGSDDGPDALGALVCGRLARAPEPRG